MKVYFEFRKFRMIIVSLVFEYPIILYVGYNKVRNTCIKKGFYING